MLDQCPWASPCHLNLSLLSLNTHLACFVFLFYLYVSNSLHNSFCLKPILSQGLSLIFSQSQFSSSKTLSLRFFFLGFCTKFCFSYFLFVSCTRFIFPIFLLDYIFFVSELFVILISSRLHLLKFLTPLSFLGFSRFSLSQVSSFSLSQQHHLLGFSQVYSQS